MKNTAIAKLELEAAELRHTLETADGMSDEQVADLQRQLFAKEFKCRDAKLYLFKNAYMDARTPLAKKYFICTMNAKEQAPSDVLKRMAFLVRHHVVQKDARDELRHAAEDMCERIGKYLSLHWKLTQTADDSFVVDFREPAHDAPVFLPSPLFTGKPAPRTMETLQAVVEKEWKTLMAAIVRDKRIDTDDREEKRQAVIDACRNMADHDILWYLSILPENDGGDFAEVLEDLDDGLLPVNAARYEIAAQIGAKF